MTRRARWARRVVLGSGASGLLLAAAACDLLMTDPAPPSEVGIAFQIQGNPRGGSATAFGRVRRVALRFARPDGSTRDTVVSVQPLNGTIRAGISLQTGERVEALGIGAELRASTEGLFQGAAVVPIAPGAPTAAEIPLVPIPAAVVADVDQLTLAGPGATGQLGSAVLFASGDTIDDLQGLWVSEDPTTVAVLPNGLATGVRLGTTRLEVRLDTLADTVTVTVGAAPPTTGSVVSWAATGDGNWSDPANWAGGVVPTVGDSVEIVANGAYTILLDASPDLASLVIGGATGSQTILATGRTITVSGDVNVVGTGTLDLGASTLSTAGLSNATTGSLMLDGSTVNGPVDNSGTALAQGVSRITSLTARPGSVMRVESRGSTDAQLTIDNGFTNGGAIELAGGGSGDAILVVASGTLVNAAPATITATDPNDHAIVAELDNRGTISTSASSLTLQNPTANATVNSGTITATGGDVALVTGAGGLTNSGDIDTSAGGDLSVTTAGPFTTSGTVATGGGTVAVTGGTMSYTGGELALGDVLTLDGVGATFTTAMTLGTTGPLTLDLSASTLTTPGLTTATATLLRLNASALNGPLDNQGDLVVRGTSALNGPLTTGIGSLLRLDGAAALPAALTVANAFTNNGTLELTNSTAGGDALLAVTTGGVSNTTGAAIRALPGAGGGTRTVDAGVGTTGTIELGHPLTIGGQLVDPAGAPSTYIGNGNALTVSGLNVDGAVFDDMPLVSNGGTLALFDNATFQNMDPTVTQLTISHPGAATAVLMNGVSFTTRPTTGLYLSVAETNPAAPTLILELLGAFPVSGFAESLAVGGAVLIW